MIRRVLIPVALAAGLLFTAARDSHAITSCSKACGPNKPCQTPCYLGTYQHPFVTTCDQVGPCQRVPDVSGDVFGADDCSAEGGAAAPSAGNPALTWLALAWLEDGVRAIRDSAGPLAMLVG